MIICIKTIYFIDLTLSFMIWRRRVITWRL